MESPYRRIYSGDSSRRSLYGRPNSAFRTLSRQASTAASTATLGRVSTPLQTARQTLRLPPPKPSISRAGCSSAVSDFFSEVKKGKHGNDRDKCRQNGHEELQEQEPSKPNYNSEHVQHLGAFAVDKQQSPRVQATHDRIDISVGEQKKGTTAAAGNGMSFGGSGFDLQGKEESAGRKGGEQVPPHMGERKRREDETDCVNRMIPKDETAPGESVPLRSQHQLDQHGAITPHATDCLLSRQPFFTHERSLDSLHSLPLMPHSLSSRTVLRTELSIEKKLGPAAPLCKTKSPRMKTGLAKSEGHLTRTIAPETQAQPATETRTARYKASPPTQPGVHTSQVGTRNTKAKPCNRKMPTYLGSGSRKKARSSSCGLPPERLSRAGLRPGYAGRLSGGRRQQLSRSCQQTPQPQLSPVTPPGAVNLPTNESLNFSPLSASLPPTCSLPSQQVPPFPIDVKALREATASFLRPEGPPLPEPESFNPVSIPVTQYTPKREKLGQNVSVHGDAAPVNTEGLRYSSKHLPPLSEAELATSAASALCATVSPGVSSPDHEVPQKAERKGFTFQSVSTFSDTQSSRLQIQRETKQDVASLKERESRAIPGKGQQRKCREDSPSKNIVLQGLSPRSRSEVKREMKRWFKERSAAASRQGDFFPPQNTGGESHTLSKLTEDLRFHSPEQLVLYYKKQIDTKGDDKRDRRRSSSSHRESLYLLISLYTPKSSSHPILAPEENSSSSSSCCTTIQPTPREEAEEERKRRSRLGDTRSSSSHRKVLSLRKKEKNPGGRSIKKGEQQSRLAIIDSPPSCMQRRKKLLSATHLRRSKSITTTITGSTLNAKRRSLSLLHEKKESDDDFLSPNEYHRSISLQGKSRKQRTYLGPSSEPGGVIKVVRQLMYKEKEEKDWGVYTPHGGTRNAFSWRDSKKRGVSTLRRSQTSHSEAYNPRRPSTQTGVSEDTEAGVCVKKGVRDFVEYTVSSSCLSLRLRLDFEHDRVMKELNEKEKQLIDTAERYFHVKHQLTDLQTLHKEETQRTKRKGILHDATSWRRQPSLSLSSKFQLWYEEDVVERSSSCLPLCIFLQVKRFLSFDPFFLVDQQKQLEAMERKNKKEVHELRRAAEIARQKLRTVEFRRRCDLEGFSVDALQWRKRMQGLERWSYMLGRLLESRLKLSLSYRDRAVVTREHEELEEALRDLKASMCLSFNPKKEKKEIEKSMKRKESEVSLEIDEREEGDPKPYTKATQVEISPSSSSPPGRSLCRQEEKREGKTRDTSNLQSDSQVDPSPPLPYHLTGEKTSCPSFPLFQREEENNSSSSDAPPDVPSKSSSSSSSFSYPSHSSVTSSSSSSFLRKVSPLQSIYTESPPVATLPSSSSSKEIEGSSIALAQERESKLHPTIDVPKREGEKNEDVERSTRNAGDRRSPSRALSYPSSSCLFGISLSPQALRSFSHTLPSTISPAGILPAKKDSSCSSSLRPLEKIHSSSSLSNSSSSSSHPPGDVFQTHSHFKTSSSSSSSSTLCLSSSSSSSAYPSETLSPFPLYSPSPCVLLNSSSSSGPCKDHRCCHVSAGVPYHPSPCPSLLVHPPGGPCSPPPSSSSHVSCVVHSQAASSSLPSFFSRPPCGYKREDVHVDTNTLVTSIQSNLQKKETSLSTTTHEPPFIQSSTFSSSSSSSSSSSFSSSSSSSFSSSSSSSFSSSSSSSFLSSSSSSFSSSALLDCRGPPSSSSSMNVLARESHLSERDLHPLHLHPLFSAPSSSFSVFQNSDPSSSSLSCDSSLCLSQQPKSASTPVVLYLPSHSSQPLPHAYLEEDEEEKKNEGKKAKEKILPFSTSSTHAKISYQSTHHSHLTTPRRTTDCKPPSRLASSSSLLLPSEERGKRQKKAFFFFQQKGEKEERNTNRQNNPTSLLSPKKEIFESPDKKERNPPIYLRHNPSCSSSSSLPSKIAHHLSASSSPCPSPCPPITSATDPSIQLGATLTEGATIDSRRHSPCYPLVAPEEEGSLLSSSSSLNRSSLLPQEKESKSLFFVNQSNPSPPAFMTTQASAMGPSSLSSSSSLTDHFQHPDKRERENKEESNRPSSSSSIPSSSIQQIPRSAEPKGESSVSQSLLKGQKERHKEGDRDDKSLSVREISSSRSHERSSSIPLFFNSEEMVSYLPNPPSSSLSYQQHISPSYLPEPSSSESPLPRKALLSQTLSPHAVASSPLPLRGGDFRDEERQREKETKKKEEKEDDRREDREKIESEEEMKRHKIKRREEREIVESYDKSERPTSLCQSASFLCLSLQEGERKTSRNTFQILPFMSCREREKEESLHGNRSSSSSSADSASHLEIRRHELIANSFHDSIPHREPVLGYDDVFWQKKSQDENTALEGMKKTLPQEGDHRGGEDPKKSVLGCHNRSTHEDLTDPVSAMQSIREWWRQSTQEWKGLPSIQQEEEEGGEEMREPQPISREQRRGEEDGGEGERSLKGQQGSSLEKSKEGRRKEEEGVTVVNSRASSTSLTSLREDGLKEKKKKNNNSMAIARGEEKKKKKKADKEEQDEDDDRQQEKDEEEEEETPERRIEKKCERRNYDDKARSSITRKREEESSFASYRQPLCILSTPSKASSHLPLVNFPLPSSLYSVFSTASFSSSSDHHARTKKTNEKEEEEKTQQSLQYGHPSSPVSSSSRCKDFSTKEEKRHFTRDFSQGGTVPSSSFSFFSSSLSQDMTGLQRPLRKEEKGRGEDIGRGGEQERQEGEGENVLVVYDRQQDVSSSKKKRVKESLSPNRPSSSSHLSPVSSASSSLISPSRRHRTMKICREEAPLNRVAQPPYPLLHSLQFSGKEDYLKDTKKEKEDLHTRSSSDREDKRQKKKKKKTEEVHSTRRGDVGNDEEDEEKKKKKKEEEEEKRRERKVAKDLRDAAHLDELRSKREDEEEECREAPDEGFERELTVETFLSLLQGRKDVCNEENKGKRKTGGSYRERRGSSREGEEEEEKVMKRQGGRRRHEDKEESHMKYLEGKKKNKIIREMFPQTQSPSSSSYHPYLSTFPSMSHPFSSSSSCFLPFSLWTSSYSPESIHRHLPSAYRDTSYQIHLERSDETTLGRRRRKEEENNAAKEEEESTTGDEEDGAHAVDDDLISLHALSPSPPSSSSSLLPLSPPGNVLQVSPRSISEDHLSMNEEKRKHRKNEEEEEEEGCSSSRKQRQRGLLLYDGKKWKGLDLLDTHRDRGAAAGEDEERRRRKGEGRGACSSWKSQEEKEEEEEEEKMKKKKEKEKNEVLVSQPKQRNRRTLTRTESHRCMPTYQNRSSSSSSSITLTTTTT
ncbi:hypothetical protein CSUI_004170 [Cystoisospora suis]|uniref:Uncharacterized protein n=1 Tax=Cystoisospora suis TaxID=483139 RepID=A0A2C6L243_9APIC|nr:hypothetical protein CSUI_004170 [Cystoisospora suis]